MYAKSFEAWPIIMMLPLIIKHSFIYLPAFSATKGYMIYKVSSIHIGGSFSVAMHSIATLGVPNGKYLSRKYILSFWNPWQNVSASVVSLTRCYLYDFKWWRVRHPAASAWFTFAIVGRVSESGQCQISTSPLVVYIPYYVVIIVIATWLNSVEINKPFFSNPKCDPIAHGWNV